MDLMLTILAQMREYGPDGSFPALLIWFLFVIGGIVSWIVFLVAVWRTMKAHESISDSAYRAAKAHESMANGVNTMAHSQAPLAPPTKHDVR